MELTAAAVLRSMSSSIKPLQIGVEKYQFDEEFNRLVMASAESGNSFTALLELPPNRAVQLLYSDESSEPSNSMKVKAERTGSVSNPNSSGPSEDGKTLKRKGREMKMKGKASSKKSKATATEEKLPYVHVRARRGQATDSHSLAERARREKIKARMNLLQELVPGCNKISGTALVLDEIINHVQCLQRQVEYLSMRLAAVNPRVDFNLDSMFSAGNESLMDCNIPNMAIPIMWPEAQVNGDRQLFQSQFHFQSLNEPWVKEESYHNLVASENSLLSYDSPANSASLHSGQLKMEL